MYRLLITAKEKYKKGDIIKTVHGNLRITREDFKWNETLTLIKADGWITLYDKKTDMWAEKAEE